MALSLSYTIQDSISKMTPFFFALRKELSEVSHRAAHVAGDRLMKLREDLMRGEGGKSPEEQQSYFLTWENAQPATLSNANDHCKALTAICLAQLRKDIEKAGFVLPPPLQHIEFDIKNENVKILLADVDTAQKKINDTPSSLRGA